MLSSWGQCVHSCDVLDTLTIVVPIFMIIGLGFAAARTGVLATRVGEGLSQYVFVIAIPILLFRSLGNSALPDIQPWLFFLSYFLGLMIVWAITTLIANKGFGIAGQALPIIGFTSSQSNTVFIGIPLVLRAFGDSGSVPLFLLIAIHLPITMTIATLMVEKAEVEGQIGRGNIWLEMLKKIATHPILLGIFAGIAFKLSGLRLPVTVDSASKLIADSAAPTALFALGMTLCRYGLNAPGGLLAAVTFLKLILQPAIVYGLAFHVLPMPPLWATVSVLVAACPTGVNSFLLADRYKAGVAVASATIAMTTFFAVITMTGWLWIMTPVK